MRWEDHYCLRLCSHILDMSHYYYNGDPQCTRIWCSGCDREIIWECDEVECEDGEFRYYCERKKCQTEYLEIKSEIEMNIENAQP